MQYMGGKSRITKNIVPIINRWAASRPAYIEPFVGAGWVASMVQHPTKRLFDSNQALVSMWRALLDGWDPPSSVTELEYAAARALPDSDPLKAFVGFGCSFGGKWFGGYARRGTYNFAASARNSLRRKLIGLQTARFECRDYRELRPQNCLIYCDPPYANTTTYSAADRFDSAEFWSVVRKWAESNTVLVSEYTAPGDVREVWSKPVTRVLSAGVNGVGTQRIERLFLLPAR